MRNMNLSTGLSIFLIVGISLLILNCGEKTAGVTEIGNSDNAIVSGYIYTEAGSPSAKTNVRFIPVGYNPHAGALAKKTAAADTLSTTTNDSGWYGTDDLDTGTYNVYGEAEDGDLSLIDSVVVTEDTLEIEPDTVKEPGSLEGFIKLQPGDEPDKIIAIVMGSNQFFFVGTDASFDMPELAEGEYAVKFFSTLDKYSNLDTNFTITAGEALVIPDSIVIPLKIPIPTNFALEYDTLKQIVSLSWDKMDEEKVVGYNVYRKLEGGTDSLLTAVVIIDTFFVDSSVVQDETYSYSVASVGAGDEVGVKGEGETIIAISAFQLITTIETDNLVIPGELKIDKEGRIIVPNIDPNGGNHNIVIFDSNFSFVSSFGEGLLNFPASVELDSLDNIYVGAQNGVFKFSSDGSIIDTFFVTTSGFPIAYLEIADSVLYISNGGYGEIKKFTLNGESITSWGGVGNSDGLFEGGGNLGISVFNDEVYVCDQHGRKIQIFDLKGSYLSSWSEPFAEYTQAQPIRISMDSNNNFYVTLQSPNSILIFNEDKVQQGKIVFESPTPDIKGTLITNDKIFIPMGNFIRVYSKPTY